MKNPYYYIGQNPTCDLVILNPEKKILLIKRSETSAACPGMWALPGGFINSLPQSEASLGAPIKVKSWIAGAETPDEAAKRELKEETNLDLNEAVVLPVGVYEGNQRDPRDNPESWSKSYAFYHEIDIKVFEDNKAIIKGMDDAEDADFKSIPEILAMDMAFDHKKIIIDALLKYYPDLLEEYQEVKSERNKLKR